MAPVTATKARGRLHTILGDAVPRLIDHNPAVIPRRRGKVSGRKADRAPERKWASPLQALLVAERCGALSGRDDDFILVITIAYTGMRWADVVGLERPFCRLSSIEVKWQLYEHETGWLRQAPKDDSYRNLDLPPFLASLLSRQKQAGRGLHVFPGRKPCTCTPDDAKGHYRRTNFSERRFRPAADGVHPGRNGKRARPAQPVLVDGRTGRPLQRPWPYVDVNDPDWAPPQGVGYPRYEDVPVASWLPIMRELTPHGLRHGHKVWMDEIGIPEVLKEQRMGHDLPGVRGVYSHVSPEMRRRLSDGLQKMWEISLQERAAMSRHSPVAVLDELLAGVRETPLKVISHSSPITPVTRIDRSA